VCGRCRRTTQVPTHKSLSTCIDCFSNPPAPQKTTGEALLQQQSERRMVLQTGGRRPQMAMRRNVLRYFSKLASCTSCQAALAARAQQSSPQCTITMAVEPGNPRTKNGCISAACPGLRGMACHRQLGKWPSAHTRKRTICGSKPVSLHRRRAGRARRMVRTSSGACAVRVTGNLTTRGHARGR